MILLGKLQILDHQRIITNRIELIFGNLEQINVIHLRGYVDSREIERNITNIIILIMQMSAINIITDRLSDINEV